jgi:hypothetical protein
MLIPMDIHALLAIWPASLSGLPSERTRQCAERTLPTPPKAAQDLTLLRRIMWLRAAANVRIHGSQTKTMTMVGFHARDASQVLRIRYSTRLDTSPLLEQLKLVNLPYRILCALEETAPSRFLRFTLRIS